MTFSLTFNNSCSARRSDVGSNIFLFLRGWAIITKGSVQNDNVQCPTISLLFF